MAFAFPYMTARPLGDPAYVQLEAGHRPLYPKASASQATSNFCGVFLRCFAATSGIVMLAFFFVMRYAYHDPEFEDNFTMIWCSIMILLMVGLCFLLAHDEDGDLEI